MKSLSVPCVLCKQDQTAHVWSDEERFQNRRDYFACRVCGLFFVHPDQRLSPEEEFERYQNHENHPQDANYRAFLARLFDPLSERLPSGSKGLDFGSGPGPALHLMFEEAGHQMEIFDIFYANHPDRLRQRYDFITATETIEHLFNPLEELDRLWNCLRHGGWLGIMTSLLENPEEFSEWHYKNDDTHVVFFQKQTFEWLKGHWGGEMVNPARNVILFRKQS